MRNIFDRYYKEYDEWYERNRPVYLSEVEAIRKVLPERGKGLEIGVGTGRFASVLGIRYGIEPSKNMAQIAQRRGVEVKIGYAENLPLKDKELDFILIAITICFVRNPKKVIYEAQRVLKDRGRIIIAIIDKDSFLGRLYQKKKSKFYKQAKFFSVKEVVKLLKEEGFSNLSFYQTIFKFPSEIMNIENAKPGYGKGGFVVISGEKQNRKTLRIRKKFQQYEKIRLLFKKYSYDMDGAREMVLKRAGKIKEQILDVGTGPGRMAYALALAGFSLSTVDISDKAINVAKLYAQKYKVLTKIKFLNMDAEDLRFKSSSFNTVFSANLLHDVKNSERVVDEIIRVCKVKGRIIISDLNKKGKTIVNKVYRINKEVHRAKVIDLDKVVGLRFNAQRVLFNKYIDGPITTFVGRKIY